MSKKSFDVSSYENKTLIGDFNISLEDKNLQHFTDCFDLENLINEPTSFKGIPSCIDFIIANRKSYFKNAFEAVIGISDFHKLMAGSLKTQIIKDPQKIKTYRTCKLFDKNKFNENLKSKPDSIETLEYPLFESIYIDFLYTYAPVTTKIVRANNH